jgi:WD40-like Beta Propeller Repeat
MFESGSFQARLCQGPTRRSFLRAGLMDGNSLVYLSERKGKFDLYVVEVGE